MWQGRTDGLVADGDAWLVDFIVDETVTKAGRIKYKVRWEGWDASWDSWLERSQTPALCIEQWAAEKKAASKQGALASFVAMLTSEESSQVRLCVFGGERGRTRT